MSTFYVDTRAIAKRYISELGSSWVQQLADPVAGHQLIVCDLTEVELASVLARRLREKKMTAADVTRIEANYQFHLVNEYWVSALTNSIMVLARQLLHRQALKTLDAIHLACALEVKQTTGISLTFVTSDTHLIAAAASEGLPTDDPLSHP